ncbi:MAG: MFS transporter [Pirellulales bacterium]|nr:MFS transporter [Pirellulales bacterium]
MTDQSKRFQIFLASFLTLIAAGMGFSARGGIKDLWGAQYGFTNTEIGQISGMGLAGFGLVILAASLFADRVGYKVLMLLAFLCHLISGGIMLAATPLFESQGQGAAYWCLFLGMFIFSVGNGLAEAAINPLVATLYPNAKTHYLNILHAGWPGGLVLGSLVTMVSGNMGVKMWEVPMLLFLVPTVIYGFITIKEHFPEPETKTAGISYGEMFSQFSSPILLFLLLIHACVGYVELGTDSWIQTITNKFSDGQGPILFIYASTLMFFLRFFAGPIVERINPIGLLLVSAIFGAVGLYLISNSATVLMVWITMTIYALGKTFLWPTMLGVVGDKFPRGGAVTMGAMGGIGMLSAGLLGDPGIGYKQDFFATQNLTVDNNYQETFDRFKSSKENGFLFFPKIFGLDGAKKEVILDPSKSGPGTILQDTIDKLTKQNKLTDAHEVLALQKWWESAKSYADVDKPKIEAADTFGGRMALRITAAVPAFMAVCYLILFLYFQATGGYKMEHLHKEAEAPSEY